MNTKYNNNTAVARTVMVGLIILALVGTAAGMIFKGISDGWGWFLFVAVIIANCFPPLNKKEEGD